MARGQDEVAQKFAYFGEGAKNWERVQRVNTDPKGKCLSYNRNSLISSKMKILFEYFEEERRRYTEPIPFIGVRMSRKMNLP